jgi:hypothetical protein
MIANHLRIGRTLAFTFSAALIVSIATPARADYVSEVLADNPIGYWRFEEDSGLAIDSSPTGADGTYNNVLSGVFPGAGTIGGKSASFDGSTSFVDLPGTWGGAGMTELTLEAWVNNADPVTGTFQAILSGHDPNAFAHFQLHSAGNMGAYTDPGNAFVAAPIVPATPTGEWRHVVMTSKSGETKVYLDGVQFGATVATAFDNISASSNVDIGIGHLGTRFFSGLLDEVAIYDSALSAERVDAHFAAGGGTPPPPPPPAALLAHWTFDADGSDETGNHPAALQTGASISSSAKVGGGALDLDGATGYARVPTTVLDGASNFSIATFVSVDNLAAGCCTALFTNNSWSPGRLHMNISSGTAIPELAINGNGVGAWGIDAAIPTDGSWFHLAFTYDGSTGTVTPYINGIAGNATSGATVNAVGIGPVSIGTWDSSLDGSGTTARWLDGRLDDFRVYSGVLSPEEIGAIAAIPEPSSLVLLAIAIAGFVTGRSQRRR